MGRCEINFLKKMKKYCLNKRGCRIDKLMWIFCKNECIKYKKNMFMYVCISCGGGWLPLHHGIVRFQLKAPEKDN